MFECEIVFLNLLFLLFKVLILLSISEQSNSQSQETNNETSSGKKVCYLRIFQQYFMQFDIINMNVISKFVIIILGQTVCIIAIYCKRRIEEEE